MLLPVIFWLAYFLYEWLTNAYWMSEYERYFFNALIIVPITFTATLFTTEVLIKRLLRKDKVWQFWLVLILSIIFFGVTRRAYNYFYVYPVYNPEYARTMPFLFFPKVVIEAVNIYLIVALYSMFYFKQAWYEEQRVSQALQKDNVEAQLQLLQSQVQPHFIFNTLNNIYSMAIKSNPQTPDLIYRLSALLSYMLYDSKQALIPASKELQYIYNYIELEKIRYSNKLDVSINVYDELTNFCIAPLLLLPLVENSFKHGVSDCLESSWIRMDLSIKDDWLTVKIENSQHNKSQVNGHKHNTTGNGIGIENVKQRLHLLYNGNHEYKCIHDEQTYLTVLRIKNIEA